MELVKHETCLEYFRRRLSEGWKCISFEGYKAVLLSPEGIKKELDLRNGVETLRPNAPGDSTDFFKIGAATNWECVDEVVADENGSYVYTPMNGQDDLYNIADSGVGEGAITKVTVYWRIRYHTVDDRWGYYGIKSGATEDWGPYRQYFAGYDDYNIVYPTDPDTALAWTWAAVNALQVGVKTSVLGATEGLACTQIYVEVDYPTLENKSANMGSKMVAAGLI